MNKYDLNVEGMKCINCSNRIEKVLSEDKNIKSVKADYKNNKVVVESSLSKEEIKDMIDDCGFTVI